MKTIISITALIFGLAVCCGPVSAAAPVKATAKAPSASFVINDLTDADNDISGCTTMLNRTTGNQGQVFLEDGVDTGAKGYIRVDGLRLSVALTKSVRSDTGAIRTFANKAKALTVIETTKTGASHQESDSVEQTGTIAVTYKGITQTLKVEGGTAC